MIEINLLEKRKPFKLPVVLGVDLNEVKFRPIIFAYTISILLDAFVAPSLTGQTAELKQEVDTQRKLLRKIKAKLRKNRDINLKLKAFDEQIQKLRDREKQVEEIMKQRSNPKDILSSISKITPEDLWFDSLEIDSSKRITIEGGAISYVSLGNLISKANELTYFGGTIIIDESKTEEEKIGISRYQIQKFKVSGQVESY